MWLDPEEISSWAYCYCRDIKDNLEVRSLITDSCWAYNYCIWIKNDPVIRKYINKYKE